MVQTRRGQETPRRSTEENKLLPEVRREVRRRAGSDEALQMKIREFLEDARGEKKHCAFCKYFRPTGPGADGDCTVPSDSVHVPHSYRAENEGTAAYYGNGCPFFDRAIHDLPTWDFLEEKSPLTYRPYNPEDFK